MTGTYLEWTLENTRTRWWHDSAAPAELDLGLARGACGATTNPVLASAALKSHRAQWSAEIDRAIAACAQDEAKAEALTRIVVVRAAARLAGEFAQSGHCSGFVCAQVNPARAGDRERMHAMAKRFTAWAPNIAVKLPATAAGLDVLEDCVAEGITVTATVSFTVPQVIAIAERHRSGIRRARAAGVEPGKCFAVIMIGRLDDYLREIARDSGVEVEEADIRQAGLAVTKRAYALCRERAYEATLLVAALRGEYHLTELAGADLIMSIHPTHQEPFVTRDLPREKRIDRPVPADVIERLCRMREFVRAYEPDVMPPAEFMAFGLTQRTLSQFLEAGWKPMEAFR